MRGSGRYHAAAAARQRAKHAGAQRKAMSSTGSFGQIFQTCRERVKKYEQAQSVRLLSLSLDPKPPWISKLAPDFYVLGCA